VAVIGGAVALVALVLAGAWWFLRPASHPYSPLPAAEAKPDAERACSLMREFESQVIANAQAKVVLATLDQASAAATRAGRADVVWVRLDSGVRAVRAGFKKNDARATRVGIDVVRDACAELAPAAPSP
jgi:hypothetical protein